MYLTDNKSHLWDWVILSMESLWDGTPHIKSIYIYIFFKRGICEALILLGLFLKMGKKEEYFPHISIR